MATVSIGDAVYPYWGPRSQELVDRLVADGMPQAKAKLALDYLRRNYGQPSKSWKNTPAGEITAMDGDVYPNSAAMRRDVSQNNRLKTFKTSPKTFGPKGADFSDHPLLKDSGLKDANGYPMLYNDLLRAVHDYFAHNLSSTEFGPNGEAAAWRNHMASTTSPMARWAITAETRLQNAWQNFRPEAEGVPVKDRPFAPQKASLPPVVFTLTGNDLVDTPMLEFIKTLSDEQRMGSLTADSGIKIPALPDSVRGPQFSLQVPIIKIDPGKKKIDERFSELQEAANKVSSGEMTPAQYGALANSPQFLGSIAPYSFIPKPATSGEAVSALLANKKASWERTEDINEGDSVGLRLDIPAYKDHGVWVNSIHPKGKSTRYSSAAALTDAVFPDAGDKALRVAQGSQKSPFARIEGKWLPITPDGAVARMQEVFNSPDWTQVGYNPLRHSYFFDRKTGNPVTAADEVVQIGPLVLAKNAKIESPDAVDENGERKFKFSLQVQRGINIRNDGNNRYADLIADGKKTMESRDSDSLRSYVGKTVGIIRTGEGPAKLIGSVTIGEPVEVNEKKFRGLTSKHRVPAGSTFDIKRGGTKFLYPLSDAKRFEEERDVDSRGIVAREVKFSRQIESPEFKQWFGDSKVVDADGNPLRVYTGTSKDKDFSKFNVPKNGAWFTTSPSEASMYAQDNDSRDIKYNPDTRNYEEVNTASRVMPVYLRIENPATLSAEDSQAMRMAGNYKKVQGQIFDRLRSEGYDGVDLGGGVWVVIGSPNQIKSAIGNNGEFSTKNPDIRFSRAVDAWQQIAKMDDAFKHGKSDKKDFLDISKDLLPNLVWEDKSTRYQTELQAPVQENRYAIFRERNGQVWLDVQELKSKDSGGSKIYNLVANYAFNNGLVFIGDPAGLSPTGAWRRLSNMISSSLKFGTTDHLFPHPNQFDPSRAYDYNGYGEIGEFTGNLLRPIDWRDGDSRYNLAQMLEAESVSVLAAVPELRNVKFDFEIGQFLDRSYNPFSDDAFARAAESPAARSASAGSATLKRAVFTKSALLPLDRGGLDTMGERVLAGGIDGAFGRSPLYSRNVPTPGVNFTLPARTVSERISNQLANEVSRVQAVQESVAQQGGVLTDNSDVQMAQTRMYRKSGAQIEKFRETTVRPLLKKIAKADIDTKDIAMYLYAVAARLRNQHIAEINPTQFPDGGSGMTNAEAKAYLRAFRARPDFQTLKRLARELQAITKDTQQILTQSGLVSQAEVAAWNAKYKGTYVPLKGWENVDESMNSTGKMDPRVPFAKRALGRGSRAGQIIENILGDHERAIVMAEKNAVRQAFLRFVLDNKDDALWEVDRVILSRRFIKGSPISMAQGHVSYASTVDNREANTVAVRVNGKMYSIWVKDAAMLADLNRAIAAADGDVKTVVRSWRMINAGLAKLWTALSPAFVLINAVRDLQSAMIQTGIQKKGGVLRAAGMLPKLLPLAWNIWRAERTGDWTMTGNRYKQAFNEYREVGGMQSFAGLETLEDKQRQLNKIIAEAQNTISLNPKSWYIESRKVVRSAGDFIMDINGAIENAARVAAYSAARQAGESVKEAVDTAANVTVDFARRGKMTPTMSSLYLFFNPAVQGTRRVAELAFSKKGSVFVSGLISLGYLNAMMAVGAVGDDDEPYWDKPNLNGVKLKNLVFFDSEGNRYTIPMTYGWGFFVNIGHALHDLQRGKEVGKVAAFLTSSFFQHFSPLGSTENMATFILPTLFDPVAVMATGKTEQGFPLMPEDRDQKPDSERYWTSSRGTYLQKFTEWMNSASEGSKVVPGKIDISPETLKYLTGFATGGAGSFVRDTVSSIDLELSLGDGSAIQKNQIPILKSFYQTKTIKGEQSAFFENSKAAEQALEEAKMYWGKQAPNAVMERINNSKGLAALGHAQQTAREALSNLRMQEIAVIDSQTMSPPEKEAKRADLDQKRKQLYDRFNRAFFTEERKMAD